MVVGIGCWWVLMVAIVGGGVADSGRDVYATIQGGKGERSNTLGGRHSIAAAHVTRRRLPQKYKRRRTPVLSNKHRAAAVAAAAAGGGRVRDAFRFLSLIHI